MRLPEGLEVDGERALGEDPRKWQLRLLMGLYGINQGPRISVLKLHSVLTKICFERIDYPVYVYRRNNVEIIMPIHVDDLLIPPMPSRRSNPISLPTSKFMIRAPRLLSSVPTAYPSLAMSSQFNMSECNPVLHR